MITLKLFTLLFLLTCFTLQKITLAELSNMRNDELNSGQLIEVVQHAESRSIDTLQRNYYTLKVIHRQKRKAYDHMNALYETVIRILKKNKVIPHSNSLVQSKIKPQYLSKKRKWSFSMIFVIFGNQNELTRCSSELYKYGIQRLVTKPSINFLNQKMLALQVFSSAKAKLQKQLLRFSNFQIKEVQKIEIEGRQIINSEILQNQIQQQFSQSEQQQIVEEQDLKQKTSTKQKQPLSIRVVFRVGQEQEEQSQDYYQQVEQNSQNSEDDSEEESM